MSAHLIPRALRADHRGEALAGYLRPWRKGSRTRALTIEAEPYVAGGRARVIATVPRSADGAADQAVADTIVAAFAIADAVRQLLRDGVSDDFGVFSYCAPPPAGSRRRSAPARAARHHAARAARTLPRVPGEVRR